MSGSEKPDIAVLIPVFDDGEGLRKAVASLSDQGVAFDIIIVDDGSPSPPEAPPHPGVGTVILHRLDRNFGIVGALNFGLDYARSGGYAFIARLDAGDTCRPGRLLRQVEVLRNRPATMVVGTFAALRNADGGHLGTMRLPVGARTIRNAIHYRNCFVHPSVMIRASVLEDIGGYRPGFKHAEDYDLFMRITRTHETDNIPEPLIEYYISDSSVSSRFVRSQTIGIIKTCLAHFRPLYWGSYFGIIRRVPNIFLSRRTMTTLKRWMRLV
jgi:glycosyltransferase involved in cell wall biosynthesis